MQDVAPTLPAKPSAICIAPTRELALQVAKHLRAVAAGSLLERRGTIVTLVGGMAEVKQRRLLSFAPKVVVATPGRLYDLIEAEAISLANVRVFGVHPRTSSRFFFLRHEASAVVDGGRRRPRSAARTPPPALPLARPHGFRSCTHWQTRLLLSFPPPPARFVSSCSTKQIISRRRIRFRRYQKSSRKSRPAVEGVSSLSSPRRSLWTSPGRA